MNDLFERYSWLKITTTVEEYVDASYYNKILKDYIFNNKSDLEYFDNWLSNLETTGKKVLELGCGSGRVTDVLLNKNINYSKLILLDLSNQMLDFCKQKYKDKDIEYVKSDSIKYLDLAEEKFDIVYTLWSFSHSVHQIFHELGLKEGKVYIKKVLSNFFRRKMSKNGQFFLIHFDSMSDEQKILMKQWHKVYKTFSNIEEQSPSLKVIEEVFNELQEDGIIQFQEQHYIGKEIVYKNINEALEIFMNFHMESYFNESNDVEKIINELKNYFQLFTNEDGTISIKPGCFIFEVKINV